MTVEREYLRGKYTKYLFNPVIKKPRGVVRTQKIKKKSDYLGEMRASKFFYRKNHTILFGVEYKNIPRKIVEIYQCATK